MKIKCLFGMRSNGYGIELMVAWDEYCIDENSEGFEEDCKKAKASWGTDLLTTRFVEIQINGGTLMGFFDNESMKGAISLKE